MDYREQLMEIAEIAGVKYDLASSKRFLLNTLLMSMDDEEAIGFMNDTFMMLEDEIDTMYHKIKESQ
jgi:hypothetical protein